MPSKKKIKLIKTKDNQNKTKLKKIKRDEPIVGYGTGQFGK